MRPVPRILLALFALPGCRPVPAPAPAQAPTATATVAPPVRAAAAFMQGMIGHHAQALDLAALVAERASHPSLRLLAERIQVSQKDEIALMQRWLRSRGHAVPDADAHVHAAMGHGELMPGMLDAAQLDSLAAARGPAFDRLFLEGMIRHHEGALKMVADLMAATSALDAETFSFVSDIDADQRAEIRRMKTLLTSLP